MLSNESNETVEELKGEPTDAQSTQEEKDLPTENEAKVEGSNEIDTKKEEKSAVQKRIDTLTFERRKAEAERDRLLSIIEKTVPQKTQPEPEKEPEKFENIEEYTDYLVNKKMKEKMVEFEEKVSRKEHEVKTQTVIEDFKNKAESFMEKNPDFFEKVNDPTLPTSEQIRDAIIESDRGPEVAYWLANHPEELTKIVKLSPYKQVIAIGRIEARFQDDKSTTTKITNAPEPISATKGSVSIPDGPSDKDDMNTWLQKERARLKKIGRIRY